MKRFQAAVGSFIAVGITCAAAIGAQEVAPTVSQMVGTWDVAQRMWPGPNSVPITLPPAIARRHIVGSMLLQESMEALLGSKQPFTRVANFGYNAVTRQYEYFSWDSRAPQMMTEKSRVLTTSESGAEPSAIRLDGGAFVAPQWGQMKNMAFRYRLTVGQIQAGRQTVRLYLTAKSGADAEEFLAYEYVYTKRHQ